VEGGLAFEPCPEKFEDCTCHGRPRNAIK
jgi:hypothetical protein